MTQQYEGWDRINPGIDGLPDPMKHGMMGAS